MKKTLFFVTMIALFPFIGFTQPATDIQTKYPSWAQKAVIYEVNVRQHTPEGTFKALEKDLPRLQQLGVDILWLMPINPIGEKNRKGKLGSYYSVKNYKEVNPEFGNALDFGSLVKKAHELKFKVIIDWVANHSSWDNIWMKEHPEWYKKDSTGKFVSPYDWTDVVSLDFTNKDMRNAMVDAMKFWVKNYDIDGFRCDVAGLVPRDFWEQARIELESGKVKGESGKKLFMLAEEEENVGMCEKAFDMFYGWRLHHLMNKVAKGEMKADTIIKYQLASEKKFLPSTVAFKMNFITNHDENSWNGTIKEKFGDGFKAFAILTYTLPGMPLLYSGQEFGMEKRLRFFEKDTVDGKHKELGAFYKSLNQMKHENRVLWTAPGGRFIPVYNTKPAQIITFLRVEGHQRIFVVVNASAEKVTFTLNGNQYAGKYNEFFTKEKMSYKGDDQMVMPGWGYKVFVSCE